MSVSKKRAAPRPPQEVPNPGGQNKENETMMKKENGHGDVKPKMDEYVLLKVVLPDQKMEEITIASTMALMDLRMQLCGKYKLMPSSYDLEPLDSQGHFIPFTSSSTVASTNAEAVALKSKAKGPVKVTPPKVVEQTVRLTIKLSRSNQQVLRVRPNVPLSNLLPQIFEKAGYRQEKHQFLELRRPTDLNIKLDTSRTLDDHKIREVIVLDTRAKLEDMDTISMHSEISSEKKTQKETETGKLSNKRGSKKLKAFFKLSKKSKRAPLSEFPGTSQSPSTSPQVPVTKAEELRQHPNFANANENNSNLREEAQHGKKKRAAPIHQDESLHGQVSGKTDGVANCETLEKQESIESNEEIMEEHEVKKIAPARPTAPPRAKPRHNVPHTRLHSAGKKKAPPPPTAAGETDSPSPTSKSARPEKPPRKLSVERNKEPPQVIEKEHRDEIDGMQDDVLATKSIESPPESVRTNDSSEKVPSEVDNLEDSLDDKDSVNSEEIGITLDIIHDDAVHQEDADSVKISDVSDDSSTNQEIPVNAEIDGQHTDEDSQSDKEDEQSMVTSQIPDDDTFVIIDAKDLDDEEADVEEQNDSDKHEDDNMDPVTGVQEEFKSTDAEILADTKSESSEDEMQETGFFPQPDGDTSGNVIHVSATPDQITETESVEYMKMAERAEEKFSDDAMLDQEAKLDALQKIRVKSESSETSQKEGEEPPLEDSDNLFTAPKHFDPYFGQKQANEGFDFMAAAQKMIAEFNEPFVEKTTEEESENIEEFFPPPPPEVLGEKSKPQTKVGDRKPTVDEKSEDSDDEEKLRQIEKLREQINLAKMEKARKEAEEEQAKKNPYTIVQSNKKAADKDEIVPANMPNTFQFIPKQRKKNVVYENYEAAQLAAVNLSESGEIRGVVISPPDSSNGAKGKKSKEEVSALTEEKDTDTAVIPATPLVVSAESAVNQNSFPTVVVIEKEPATAKDVPATVIKEKVPEPAKETKMLSMTAKDVPAAVVKEKEPEPVKETKTSSPPDVAIITKKKDPEPPKTSALKGPGGYVSSAVKRRPPNADKQFAPTKADLEQDTGTSSRKSTLPNYYMKFFSMKALQSAAEDAKDKREKPNAATDEKPKQKVVENGEVSSQKPFSSPIKPVSPVKSTSPIKPSPPEKPKSLLEVTTSTPKTKPMKRTPSPISDIKQINEILNSPSIEQLPLPPEENYSAEQPKFKNEIVDDFPLPPPPEEFLTPGDDQVLDVPPPPLNNDHTRQSSDSSTTSASSPPIFSPQSPNYVGFSSAKPFSPSAGGVKPQFRRMAAAMKVSSTVCAELI